MFLKALTVSITALFLSLLGFPSIQKSENRIQDNHKIRIEVSMVSLPVVVMNKEGRRITDLKKEDFRVFENGVEQEIAGFAGTDEPVSIALLLDTSGSTELKLAKIQNAAIDFVNQLHPDDEVAVLSFADEVILQQDFSIDRDKNEYGIKKTRTGERTVLYEAVWLALEEVLKPVQGRKALVLFTDGVDTRSGKATINETLELSMETRATIYCVYYDTEEDQYKRANRNPLKPIFPPIIISPFPPGTGQSESSLKKYETGRKYLSGLAQNSGGLMLDGTEDLRYTFEQVAKELSSQYSIGYYPSNPEYDGKFRKIEVKINRPGYIVRTKRGYYIKKDRNDP